MSNINDHYFDGHYKDIWRTIIPDELTAKEVAFIVSYFNLTPGTRVLDLMCGYGRHAVGLAEKNIEVTAVDNLKAYTNEIESIAKQKTLPIETVNADVSKYEPRGVYDLVICMGNSFNFFSESEVRNLMPRINGCLKPGKHFLLHSWSFAEIAIPTFKEKSWSEVGSLKILTDSKFLFQPTRIETDSTIITPGGAMETKKAIDYIISLSEYEKILNDTGFQLEVAYSIPGKKQFSLGDPRIYIIASKK